ncbi:MAG: EF-P lysine aminoacylase EpmA [Parachlamydiaceae bacterium]
MNTFHVLANNPDKLSALRDRSHMLAQARLFFSERGVLEVDCPLITQAASVDAHIDLITVKNLGEQRYLHSSPEYGMKRLIADGIGDIYQLAHVFREGELSQKHNPEFMMAEWYRLGFSFEAMIAETVDFVRLFVGHIPHHVISYRDAFKTFIGIDYVHATCQDLIAYLYSRGLQPYPGIEAEGKDAILNIILGSFIEPLLGEHELCVLAFYPSTQAALAKTYQRDEEKVAERFEIYYKGIELANGYHELADALEQRKRLVEANSHRRELGKAELPIDEHFLQALTKGLPDCCGVAVGFDRLMMLRLGHSHIGNVIPFYWPLA